MKESAKKKNNPNVFPPKNLEKKKLLLPINNASTGKVVLAILFIGVILGVTFQMTKIKSSHVITASEKTEKEWNINCAKEDYDPPVEGCTPLQCKRFIVDDFVTTVEIEELLEMVKGAMVFGGGGGGPTIFDLYSGALSKDEHFIDLFSKLKTANVNPFKEHQFVLIDNLITRIEDVIKKSFNISQVYLTQPLFFSRIIGSAEAKNFHDEYWHPHVDKKAYGTFTYTCLLYISTYGEDFKGGEFVFVDAEETTSVQPTKGRLSCFTSGRENLHQVNKVLSGTRYAITIPFTCDTKAHIREKLIEHKQQMLSLQSVNA